MKSHRSHVLRKISSWRKHFKRTLNRIDIINQMNIIRYNNYPPITIKILCENIKMRLYFKLLFKHSMVKLIVYVK